MDTGKGGLKEVKEEVEVMERVQDGRNERKGDSYHE